MTSRIVVATAAVAAATLASIVIPAATASAHGNARGCAAKFEATLTQHLDAITNRDLQALAPTVDESMVLIFPSGSIRQGKAAFMAFHESWFADPHWQQPYTIAQTNVQGCQTAWALIDYHYQALNSDGTVKSSSHNMFALTWTHKRGKWVAIADQNTKLPA